jgi:hypothetical protein
MDENTIVIPRETKVRSQLADTKGWAETWEASRKRVLSALLRVPAVSAELRAPSADKLYRIRLPDGLSIQKATLRHGPDGLLRAVLRNPDGTIAGFPGLERAMLGSLSSAAAPLATLAIQSMLDEVMQRLEEIDVKISSVLEGQVVDRIGSVFGGETQLESALVASGEIRKALLMQATPSLTVGRERCYMIAEKRLRSLKPILCDPSWWSRILSGNKSWKRKQKQIHDSLDETLLHLVAAARSTRCLQLIYSELGQPASAQQTVASFCKNVGSLLDDGFKAAGYLPYNDKNPPEAFWLQTRELIDKSIPIARDRFDLALPLELEFRAGEILSLGSDE